MIMAKMSTLKLPGVAEPYDIYDDSAVHAEGEGASYQQLATNKNGIIEWEDKEFYTDITMTQVLESTEYDVSTPGEGGFIPPTAYVYSPPGDADFSKYEFIPEQLYEVRIDEDTYDVISDAAQYIGPFLATENYKNGFPEGEKGFYIAMGELIALAGYEPGVHTISIMQKDVVVKQISREYIPKQVGEWYENGTGEVFNNYENNVASGEYSHAEGTGSEASGYASHAEGEHTGANGAWSHAEGQFAYADGDHSHVEGYAVKAYGQYQHVQGKGNLWDEEGKYAHIVGNGYTYDTSNAHTIDWNGNGWFAGTIKVGGTGQDDETAQEVALKSEVDTLSETVNGMNRFVTFVRNGNNIYIGSHKFSEIEPIIMNDCAKTTVVLNITGMTSDGQMCVETCRAHSMTGVQNMSTKSMSYMLFSFIQFDGTIVKFKLNPDDTFTDVSFTAPTAT